MIIDTHLHPTNVVDEATTQTAKQQLAAGTYGTPTT